METAGIKWFIMFCRVPWLTDKDPGPGATQGRDLIPVPAPALLIKEEEADM